MYCICTCISSFQTFVPYDHVITIGFLCIRKGNPILAEIEDSSIMKLDMYQAIVAVDSSAPREVVAGAVSSISITIFST